MINFVHLGHDVVGDFRFCEQYVHVAGHAACHRMNRELHIDTALPQQFGDLEHGVLGLRDSHSVPRDEDDLGCVPQDFRGVLRADRLYLTLWARCAGDHRATAGAETARNHAEEVAVHRPAHDVGQNRARRSDQRADDD